MADEVNEQARAEADRVLEAVRVALSLLDGVQDTAVRAVAAGLVLREWPAQRGTAKEVRQQAVAYLHERLGMDFPEIGTVIGTDRSRAWKIYKGI
ncbi:hypothetical protein [Streptomyces pseudovenezuelae]|uniref:hypothetical protein n=1 Tax=Streptomyces pseudovenezuelae TaxID=67350 RepID=UPI002E379B3A|nr:hypothetical protein [Streptomyces pseudovenezuelae]